jgi:hypothetical protein
MSKLNNGQAITLIMLGLVGLATHSYAANTSHITVIVIGSGSVSSSPAGIDCPDLCSADFSKSETVRLTATPQPGQMFLGWSDSCAGVEPICDLRNNKDRSVTAQFTSGSPPPVAPVTQTGQTNCYDGAGNQIDCAGTRQDGDFQEGVSWPTPRITLHGNGTAADNLTGLIWQTELCDAFVWQQGINFVSELGDGQCGLTDGSAPGDWRVPNIKELLSLYDYGTSGFPSGLPNPEGGYWTSTTNSLNPNRAWRVLFGPQDSRFSIVSAGDKILGAAKVIAVRDP